MKHYKIIILVMFSNQYSAILVMKADVQNIDCKKIKCENRERLINDRKYMVTNFNYNKYY